MQSFEERQEAEYENGKMAYIEQRQRKVNKAKPKWVIKIIFMSIAILIFKKKRTLRWCD